MRVVITFLLIGLFISSNVNSAELSLTQLIKITKAPDNLQGKFIQEKYLKKMQTTLVSSGKFQYLREKEIHWETLEPLQSKLTMTASGVIKSSASINSKNIENKSNPVTEIISEIFFSILSSQWQPLTEHFELSSQIEGQQWQVNLTPSDSSVAQLIDHLIIKGDEFVREVTIYEKSDNFTVIKFSNLQEINDQ